MVKNKLIAPFLKWVGGKRQIMPLIVEHLPKEKFTTYYEPFVGGGAVLFHLQPRKAVINDFNLELINVYKVIKNNVDELIADLKTHKNHPTYFYQLRAKDRTEEINNLSNIERASRIIYLNKTCFNGLYRVNNAGEFNSPFGSYKNPNIVNEPTLKAVSKYLNSHDIQMVAGDYENILNSISRNALVYFDPPYHPASDSSNFTGYIQGGWGSDDQIRLKEACDGLNNRNVKFLLSNSGTEYIKDLYKGYNISIIKANRAINSNGEKRGEVEEVLIRNYE
ncbi:MAG: DNA adenine methylase [Bacteroidota bacterium]